MTPPADLDIFLAAPPGYEPILSAEAAAQGFVDPVVVPGGVAIRGDWPEIWRANLVLRGTGRVLVRIGAFYAVHLAQLDKRARRLDWARILPPGARIRVDAACQGSRIYHAGAAAERISRAACDAVGGTAAPDAPIRLLARIVDDFCTLSLDTSGEPLHKRGAKLEVGAAPLRETLAALALRACGYTGAEPVLDPMCGSGTLVIEAAEWALNLAPGRARSFAFQRLEGFDPAAFARFAPAPRAAPPWFFGSDHDPSAVAMATANAARAQVDGVARFALGAVGALALPAGLAAAPPGLILTNPPYGARLGERGDLAALYATFGRRVRAGFPGWRVGLITSEPGLAQATGLAWADVGPPVPHGPLRIRLYRTAPLPDPR